MPLHHPDQADAPLVPRPDGLQHQPPRPHPGSPPVHPRLGPANVEAIPAAGAAAEQEPAQLAAQAPVQDGPDRAPGLKCNPAIFHRLNKLEWKVPVLRLKPNTLQDKPINVFSMLYALGII